MPRKELVEWLQRDFDCCVERVETCGNGAIYLQILDKVFPGKVQMKRVIWPAQTDYEKIQNYKLLQDAFLACGLQKTFNIDLLSKQRCQENLAFLQWMKAVYDHRLLQITRTAAHAATHPATLAQAPEGASAASAVSGDGVAVVKSYRAYERRLLGQGPLPDWARPRRLSLHQSHTSNTSHTSTASHAQAGEREGQESLSNDRLKPFEERQRERADQLKERIAGRAPVLGPPPHFAETRSRTGSEASPDGREKGKALKLLRPPGAGASHTGTASRQSPSFAQQRQTPAVAGELQTKLNELFTVNDFYQSKSFCLSPLSELQLFICGRFKG